MRSKLDAAVAVLVVLLAVVIYGVFATAVRVTPPPVQDTTAVAPVAGAARSALPAAEQHALATAQALVALPTTPDERPFAEDALRLGDKEMDIAFADAVRRLASRPRPVTPEVQAIMTRLRDAQKELIADSAQIIQITAAMAAASGDERMSLADRLNLAKAHLELVQDDADNTQEDLIRAGGDPQGRIQAMMEEHDSSSRSSDSTRVNVVKPAVRHGLLRHLDAWNSLRDKNTQLRTARKEAEAAAAAFAARRAAMEATRATRRRPPAVDMSHATSAALLLETQRLALVQKSRGGLAQHVDNQRQLATVYQGWMDVVGGQQRAAINRALRGLAVILVILVIGLLIDRRIEHRLANMPLDQRRAGTLYMAVRVSLQVLAFILVLLVLFGAPDNLGTFLGLAGAGLTVALKDFIIGFLGWFVLMGRDGIGSGDLVEINGVTGEVVELGLFRTVLLETGSWADSGHLTGRRVSFGNSFAIDGHYFNFSTNGRWLWDDVRFVVPTGRDPVPIAESLRQQAELLTAEGARRAESEMKGARRSPRLSAMSAVPTINIKPIVGGTEVTLRYLTHVRERSDIRAQLYQSAITLLGEQAAVRALAAVPEPEPVAVAE